MISKKNHVFLLGAGFTRAVMGNKALLADEIMPKLDIKGFPEIIDDYEKTYPDIEQFITALDLKCLRFSKNNISLAERFEEARKNIVGQIVNYFDLNTLRVDNLENYQTLKKFVMTIPAKSTILTLNYDCVMDQGLYLSGRWSPGGGYHLDSFPASNNENSNKDNILLLKLHGSCNFRESKRSDNEYPVVQITNQIFPNINASFGTIQDVGPQVLVMTYIKLFRNGMMQLWSKAIDALKDADKLAIIGCSLREEDTFLKFALYYCGRREEVTKIAIDIVDIDKERCEAIKSKLKRLVAWPDKQEIKLYDNGLDGYLSQ